MKENNKLFHKDFLLVIIGQIISLFGNSILRFALPLYIYQESGSPALPTFVVLTLCTMLMMVCATMFSIRTLAFAQSIIPAGMTGKVIALVMTASLCAQLIGQVLYGVAFEQLAKSPGIVVIASGLLSIAVALCSRSVFVGMESGTGYQEVDAVG